MHIGWTVLGDEFVWHTKTKHRCWIAAEYFKHCRSCAGSQGVFFKCNYQVMAASRSGDRVQVEWFDKSHIDDAVVACIGDLQHRIQ
ncbi:uncharacterized protein METZ01_LOCUS318289, partial [marine metagenome]